MGKLLAERGIGLVFMAAAISASWVQVADACLQAGGEMTGVIPRR